MLPELTKEVVSRLAAAQAEIDDVWRPPAEGLPASSDRVVLFSLVSNTRGYIERVVHQVNGSYEHGWYDACAVMIRRLLETLIIEAFEAHGIASQIQNAQGDFLYLADLINATLSCSAWNLSRNAKRALPRLKDVGDRSAHSRRFNAHRGDIDKLQDDIRVVVQELVSIAGLK